MIDVIINADDFGISEEVNSAITYCFKKEIITRTTIMMNMSGTLNAINLAHSKDFYTKVGLHLNIIEGKPLTNSIDSICLLDSDGNFNNQIMKFKNRFFLPKKCRDFLYLEIEEQIKIYRNSNFTLFHLDSHRHTHNNLSIIRILRTVLKNNRFATIRYSRNIPKNEIGIIKKIYKNYINISLAKIVEKKDSTGIIDLGSQEDITKLIERGNDNMIFEMMIHPYMDENGMLKDKLNSTNLEDWLAKYKDIVRVVKL